MIAGNVPGCPGDEVSRGFDDGAAVGGQGEGQAGLRTIAGHWGIEEGGAVPRIGTGEVFGLIGRAITVGVHVGRAFEAGDIAKVGEPPVGEALTRGQGAVDPGFEQVQRGLVEFAGGERWHAGEAIECSGSIVDDATQRAARDDETVGGVAAIVGRRGVDEKRLVKGQLRAAIPGGGSTGAAGLVAVSAIDGEITAHAGLNRKGGFCRPEMAREEVGRFDGVGKVARILQERELISGEAVHRAGEVELAGVRGQRMTSLRGMAGEATGTARDAPALHTWCAVFDHVQVKLHTFLGNQRGFRTGVIPAVTDAIGSASIADEEPGLQPSPSSGIPAREIHVEVLYPHLACGKAPLIIAAPGHRA